MLLCEYFLEVHSLNRFCGCELMSVILSSKVFYIFIIQSSRFSSTSFCGSVKYTAGNFFLQLTGNALVENLLGSCISHVFIALDWHQYHYHNYVQLIVGYTHTIIICDV